MTILSCSRCGAVVCTVRDTRFGILPDASLCLRCSHPAFSVR